LHGYKPGSKFLALWIVKFTFINKEDFDQFNAKFVEVQDKQLIQATRAPYFTKHTTRAQFLERRKAAKPRLLPSVHANLPDNDNLCRSATAGSHRCPVEPVPTTGTIDVTPINGSIGNIPSDRIAPAEELAAGENPVKKSRKRGRPPGNQNANSQLMNSNPGTSSTNRTKRRPKLRCEKY
jgi:hypothetical protein